jgi:outer membrane protein assembly factor BamD (BamD/ComL family)
MSISSISSSSSLWLQTLAAQQRKGVEKQGPNLQADLSQLTNSLRSGDLDAAKSDYATITSRMPTDGPGQDAEFTSALSALGAALDSGDLDAAKEALETVQEMVKNHVAQGPPPPPPPDAQGVQGAGGTTESEDPIEQLLSQLQDALESSDLDSAKNAYELLQSFLKTQTGTGSDTSSTSTSTSRRIDCFA